MMDEVQEQILSVSNIKLAVILLTFGGNLREHLPLEWDDVHESKDAFIENLGDPARCKPRRQITFNFEPTEFLKDLVRAYQSKQPKEKLQALLGKFDETRALLAMEVFKEVIAAGRFLFELIETMPENAKWDVVHGTDTSQVVKFGKHSSDELRFEYLSKI
jgi:hypothetical protein